MKIMHIPLYPKVLRNWARCLEKYKKNRISGSLSNIKFKKKGDAGLSMNITGKARFCVHINKKILKKSKVSQTAIIYVCFFFA